MDGEDVASSARGSPRCCNALGGGAHVDGVGSSGSAADGLEGVVATDGERAVAALVQGDVGIGKVSTSEGLGRG